jgi:hypothetical protein
VIHCRAHGQDVDRAPRPRPAARARAAEQRSSSTSASISTVADASEFRPAGVGSGYAGVIDIQSVRQSVVLPRAVPLSGQVSYCALHKPTVLAIDTFHYPQNDATSQRKKAFRLQFTTEPAEYTFGARSLPNYLGGNTSLIQPVIARSGTGKSILVYRYGILITTDDGASVFYLDPARCACCARGLLSAPSMCIALSCVRR